MIPLYKWPHCNGTAQFKCNKSLVNVAGVFSIVHKGREREAARKIRENKDIPGILALGKGHRNIQV